MHSFAFDGILGALNADALEDNESMAHKGHVENGAIVLDEPVDLPDGTVVELRPVSMPPGRHHPDVERFAGVIGKDSGGEEQYFEYLRKKHQ